MEKSIQVDNVEPHLSDNFKALSWNRERSSEELRAYVEARIALLSEETAL